MHAKTSLTDAFSCILCILPRRKKSLSMPDFEGNKRKMASLVTENSKR